MKDSTGVFSVTHPVFGEVELEGGGDWDTSIEFPGFSVEVDVNLHSKSANRLMSMLDKVERFVTGLKKFDGLARAAIRADLDSKRQFSVQLYMTHHLEELDPTEIRKCFGVDKSLVDAGVFLEHLKLHNVSLYPEDEDEIARFRYTIGDDVTDYRILVVFDAAGKVQAVSMVS